MVIGGCHLSSYCLSSVTCVFLVFKVSMSFIFFISYCCLLAYDLLLCASASLIAFTPIIFLFISRSRCVTKLSSSCYSNLSPHPAPEVSISFWGWVGGQGRNIYDLPTLQPSDSIKAGSCCNQWSSDNCTHAKYKMW